MRQELTAEVAAPREQVWTALAGELDQRGTHVTVLEERPPEALQLRVRSAPGERLALAYRLQPLDAEHTAVSATIAPSGPLYQVKRLLSFGAVEDGYLRLLAAGLGNLQRHFEPEEGAAGSPEPAG